MALNIVTEIDNQVSIRHVLMSVSDKSGLEDFVPGLVQNCPDVKIYSTGGTYAAIEKILGEEWAAKHLVAVSRLYRAAGNAGRTGENPGLQDLSWPAERNL